MTARDRLGRMLIETKRNAALAWLLVAALLVASVVNVAAGRYRAALFGLAVVGAAVAPAVGVRSANVAPPWLLVLLSGFPVLFNAAASQPGVLSAGYYFAVAALALLIAVELHEFTDLEMTYWFAVGLVVVTTLALAAIWNVSLWLLDHSMGTSYVLDGQSQDAINAAVMIDFGYAVGAGFAAGVLFLTYFQRGSPDDREGAATAEANEGPADDRTLGDHAGGDPLGDRFDLTESQQRRITRSMQAVLVGVVLFGIATRHVPSAVNGSIALAITFLPGFLEHDLELPMGPVLTLWITGAVFLHSLGSAGLYALIEHWDTMTHALSASIIAAAGYAVIRAIHLHAEEIHVPTKPMFVFVLIFILAVGVVWELFEFALDTGAALLGVDAVLAQHGIDDTMGDLVFNTVGAAVAAAWGSIYLTDVSGTLKRRLDERAGMK